MPSFFRRASHIERKLVEDLFAALSPEQRACALVDVPPFNPSNVPNPGGLGSSAAAQLRKDAQEDHHATFELPAMTSYLEQFFPFLTVDGGSNNKFDSFKFKIITTCFAHRSDTVQSHIMDHNLTDKSDAAVHIQQLIADQAAVVNVFRASPRLTYLLLHAQANAAVLPDGSKIRPKGYIGGSNTRWSYDVDMLNRAGELLPWAKLTLNTHGGEFGTKWTLSKRGELETEIQLAEHGWGELMYTLAGLDHMKKWMLALQSSEFAVRSLA